MRVQKKGADDSSQTLDLSDKNIKTWEIRTHSNSTTKLNLGYLQEDASFCEVWTFFKSDIPFEAQNYLVYALNEHTQNAQEDKKPRQ